MRAESTIVRRHEQAARMLQHEWHAARERVAGNAQTEAQLAPKRAQLNRVRAAHREALARGDNRRATRLGVRSTRIERELSDAELTLRDAWRASATGERAQRRHGRPFGAHTVLARERFLDAQAALPDARAGAVSISRNGSPRRDYAALASMLGYSPERYAQLDSQRQRAARLEIDRELARRRALAGVPPSRALDGGSRALDGARRAAASVPPGAHERRRARDATERSRVRGPRGGGESSARGASRAPSDPRGDVANRESTVMRDAREVLAGRKRQLGG